MTAAHGASTPPSSCGRGPQRDPSTAPAALSDDHDQRRHADFSTTDRSRTAGHPRRSQPREIPGTNEMTKLRSEGTFPLPGHRARGLDKGPRLGLTCANGLRSSPEYRGGVTFLDGDVLLDHR